MQRHINPREAKRMMQRMGMNMNAVEGVTEVVIRTPSKEIVIDGPEVALLQVRGQKIYQVAGGTVVERAPTTVEKKPKVTEEDARLVADQTGKSLEDARKALEECQGDLAKAILFLQS